MYVRNIKEKIFEIGLFFFGPALGWIFVSRISLRCKLMSMVPYLKTLSIKLADLQIVLVSYNYEPTIIVPLLL